MRLSCQRSFRPVCLPSISNVSSFRLLLLCVGKPLFTNGSIVPCARAVPFSLARFVLPPLSYMKQVPFESAGTRLQNMQKLSLYTAQGLRYMLWHADQKIVVDACMCKVSSITIRMLVCNYHTVRLSHEKGSLSCITQTKKLEYDKHRRH